MAYFADPVSERLNNVYAAEKAGPEGYVHGWVCVRPPCNHVGSAVSHPAHGLGLVTSSSHGRMVARFDDGTEGVLGDQKLPATTGAHYSHYRNLINRLTDPGNTRERLPAANAASNWHAGHILPSAKDVTQGIAESLNPLAGSKDTPFFRHVVDPSDSLARNPVRPSLNPRLDSRREND